MLSMGTSEELKKCALFIIVGWALLINYPKRLDFFMEISD